jgi:NTP pyrophosphatase (non-canonical NTP hydrolase)
LDRTKYILQQISTERARQINLWGDQINHPFKWITILQEEMGEAAKAVLEGRPDEYVAELIQVAAAAVAAIECYNRTGTVGKLNDMSIMPVR